MECEKVTVLYIYHLIYTIIFACRTYKNCSLRPKNNSRSKSRYNNNSYLHNAINNFFSIFVHVIERIFQPVSVYIGVSDVSNCFLRFVLSVQKPVQLSHGLRLHWFFVGYLLNFHTSVVSMGGACMGLLESNFLIFLC